MPKKTQNICTTVQIFRCYNNHYNPHRGTEASDSLQSLIQERRLTDSLECLENLGYGGTDALLVISSVQTLQAVGG